MATRRGFTDHEHLDKAEIIHMNGRVYDYNVGRFLSVDPVIQSPTNSQSMNPYSYIMNNPMAGTDATGYSCESNTHACADDQSSDELTKDVYSPRNRNLNKLYQWTANQGPLNRIPGHSYNNGASDSSDEDADSSSTNNAGEDVTDIAALDDEDADGLTDSDTTELSDSERVEQNVETDFNGDPDWKGRYDITIAPKHIKMAKGLKYNNLSEDEKYAVHMTEATLVQTIRLAEQSKDPQMVGISLKGINAVWYSDPDSKGAWDQLDSAYAMASYRAGENIQFNGKAMKTLLPGGKGIPGGIRMLKMGYFAVGFDGIQAGQRAFNYVVAHEVAHTTRINSISMNAESNADNFYKQLYEKD